MSTYSELPLIVIVGPTASGKSALAIELAEKYDGEIICADSRTIFREMNIGTAKPNELDLGRVPHWGLDLVNPGEYFSAADFQKYAFEKIDQIRKRGHVPFLVGGTGLYVDSVVFNFKFGSKADEGLRNRLQQMDVSQLQEYCKINNINLPENYKNKRHLIRSIETNGHSQAVKMNLTPNCIVVGITTEKEVLLARIEKRINQMLADDVIDEARNLANKYGWDCEAMKSNIYPLIGSYLDGKVSIDQLATTARTIDWHLAKRQITWLKRNKFIQWFVLDDAKKMIEEYLATVR